MCSVICSHVFLNNDDLKRQDEKNYRQNGLPLLKQDAVKVTALSSLPKTTKKMNKYIKQQLKLRNIRQQETMIIVPK